MDSIQHFDSSERFKLLVIPTSKYRRCRGDMTELWKHFHQHEKELLPASFKPLGRPNRRHSRQLYLYRPVNGVDGVQRNSFYYRTVTIWNALPSEIAEVESLDPFKNRSDNHWNRQAFRFDPSKPLSQPSHGQHIDYHQVSAASSFHDWNALCI